MNKKLSYINSGQRKKICQVGLTMKSHCRKFIADVENLYIHAREQKIIHFFFFLNFIIIYLFIIFFSAVYLRLDARRSPKHEILFVSEYYN